MKVAVRATRRGSRAEGLVVFGMFRGFRPRASCGCAAVWKGHGALHGRQVSAPVLVKKKLKTLRRSGMNLAEGLQVELKRNKELLEMYREIPGGVFGAFMIEKDIKVAEKAISEGDTIQMVKSYESLKNNE